MASAEYFCLDLATLPDELYKDEVPVREWLAKCRTAPASGFPRGSLGQLTPCPLPVELERIVGITLYMLTNVLPFALPLFSVLLLMGWFVAKMFFGYLGLLIALEMLYVLVYPPAIFNTTRERQYFYTERNTQKYMSLRMVWPKALQLPACQDTPLIFCVAPHGVAPLGVTAYPIFSKLFGDRLNHPTAAPVVMRLPLVGAALRKLGYIDAKSAAIKEVIKKKEENVTVILDGIAGMFQQDESVEKVWIKKRKGICKISLQTGAPIVPVYGFGHSQSWTVVVDPFGLLEKLSIRLDISLVPFFGRFWWPLGPPRRCPITVAFGEPLRCEQIDEPSDAQIEELHSRMVEGFRQVFDQHKDAYGWSNKSIVFV